MVAVAAVQPKAEEGSLPALRNERHAILRKLRELAAEYSLAEAVIDAIEQRREHLAQRLDQYDRAIELLDGREFRDLRDNSMSLGQRILTLLGDGNHRTSGEIAVSVSGAEKSVRVALSRMVKAGIVTSIDMGPDVVATYTVTRQLVVNVATGKRAGKKASDDAGLVLL